MTEKISQKSKVKQDIKININLADKRKRRKQRKKRTVNNFQALQRAQQERAQQILFSQATNVPRTVEQQNSGMIMDNFRNQQQQLNKHSSLINTGISQLNFIRDQIKNYQPVKQEKDFTFEIPPTPNKPEKPEPEEPVPQAPLSPKYKRISQTAFGNQRKKTVEMTKEIYINYFKDLTNEEIEDQYKTQFGELHGNVSTREGRIGALMKARFGNVTTERGGGASPLFQPEEEQAGLMGGMFGGGGDGY